MNNPQQLTESPHLLSAKVRSPNLARGYISSNELLERIEPLRRLTVLRAPSGFGKTSILADVARRWREQDALVAWLTLDEDDTPGVLDSYLAYAFQVAGLNVTTAERRIGDGDQDGGPRPRRRTELLAASIEAHAAPCLLILDEVERLNHRLSLASINFLLLHGPRNLHIALGMRENPGLDLGGAILAHEGFYITADQLRFTKPQIARFFNNELSRRELDDLAERSEGWPVAVRAYRNMKRHAWMKDVTVRDLVGDRGVTADWLGERLLRGLAAEDRKLLLDLSLFDWIAPEVAADVLRTDHIRRRVEALASLEGLLQIDSDANTVRLHPLLKDYCAARCLSENPARFRAVHAGIARAEARQGHVVLALRHASEVGDVALIGEIIEGAGGVRLWASLGAKGLIAVDGYLNDEVVETFPRAGLLRVVVLGQVSRFQEASSLYARLGAATDGFQRDRAGGDDRVLQVEHLLVQVTMVSFSCQPFRTPAVQKMLRQAEAFVQADDADLIVKGALNMTLSIVDQMRARFLSAARRGAAGMDAFSRAGAGYGNIFMRLHLGTLAFARGRVREAMEHYTHGHPTMLAELLAFEVTHERGFARPRRNAPDLLGLPNLGWFEVYAAIYSVAAELVLESEGPQAALAFVRRTLLSSQSAGLPSVERFLSILRVSCLARCGRVERAARAWAEAKLPVDEHDILDVDRQSWREMEALACARFRLHCESGAFDAALAIGDGLRTLAGQHGLWRPMMNGVALSMAAQWQAGNAERAVALLSEFLRLADSVDYVRPLVRVREQTVAVLPLLIDEGKYATYHEAAATVLAELAAETDTPALTDRELAIMRDVARGLRNKEIAKRLGITEHGVRYHLKNIYRKTGAKGRIDAVHRVRGLTDTARSL